MRKYLINSEIKKNTILLITDDGKEKMTRVDALVLASNANLDLICVADNKDYAVCKLGDYSKMLYDAKKAEKLSKKKQTNIEIHEIQLSPVISTGDMSYRAKQAKKWLEHGDLVDIKIKFKGRMITHQEFGFNKLYEFVDLIGINTKYVNKPKINDRNLTARIEMAEDTELVKN